MIKAKSKTLENKPMQENMNPQSCNNNSTYASIIEENH